MLLLMMLVVVAVVATKKAIASAAVIAWRPRWCTSEQVATSERSQSFRRSQLESAIDCGRVGAVFLLCVYVDYQTSDCQLTELTVFFRSSLRIVSSFPIC